MPQVFAIGQLTSGMAFDCDRDSPPPLRAMIAIRAIRSIDMTVDATRHMTANATATPLFAP